MSMKAEDTFSTKGKTHHTTTKDRQIDFMWHLWRQKFTYQEIADVYNVNKWQVRSALNARVNQMKS